jgi:STE24 endopeptidase
VERPSIVTAGLLAATAVLVVFWFVSSRFPAADTDALRHFSTEFLTRAQAYNRVRYGIFAGRNLAHLGVLALLVAGAPWLAGRVVALMGGRPTLGALALGLVIGSILLLADLPFGLWRYQVDTLAGLSTMPLGLWLSDTLKGFLLAQAISLPAIAVFFFLVHRFSSSWHLLAGAGLGVFLVISAALAPLVIDPLFHRFWPLEDKAMYQEIRHMAQDAGIEVRDVLVMDASRRTTRANAYFTGVGRTRRIVLYDTLTNQFPRGETLMVVAHEIGHWKAGHITKGITLGTLGFLALLGVIRVTIGTRPTVTHLPLVFLIWSLAALLSMPVNNAISRGFEREADGIALELGQDPSAWISLEKRLAAKNLADVNPHPLVKVVVFTHPPILERIATAEGAGPGRAE